MAEAKPSGEPDLSAVSAEDLQQIQNEVLRRIVALRTSPAGLRMAGHDSHGSVHSKNSVMADVVDQLIRSELPRQ